MNKSESKYFNTALRMDEALIALLEKKDLEFITVKELCQLAGVNRSTFYLHYETVADLLSETVEMINQRFLSYFPQNEKDIRNPGGMQADVRYGELKQHIFGPILERFHIPAAHRPYYIAYYVEGIIAIVKEWLRQDCKDDVDMIAQIIQVCVRPEGGSYGIHAHPLPEA